MPAEVSLAGSRQFVTRVEAPFIAAQSEDGVDVFRQDRIEVALNRRAVDKFTFFVANGAVIIASASLDRVMVETALNLSYDADNRIDPSRVRKNLTDYIPAEIGESADVIVAETRPGEGERFRLTHLTLGEGTPLNDLRIQKNGPQTSCVVEHRSYLAAATSGALVGWREYSNGQGATVAGIFILGETSLIARLTGGKRNSSRGDGDSYILTGLDSKTGTVKTPLVIVAEAGANVPIQAKATAAQFSRVLEAPPLFVITSQ